MRERGAGKRCGRWSVRRVGDGGERRQKGSGGERGRGGQLGQTDKTEAWEKRQEKRGR